ncbi:MAG: hypothetical protein AB7S38_25245 [Vulcanimicrobiota bacterium]
MHIPAGGKSLTIARRNFAADLPDEFANLEVEPKTAEISIEDRASFKVHLHYDQLVARPQFFRAMQVEVPEVEPDVRVEAEIGLPYNQGTARQPLMSVPVLLNWNGGNWHRGEAYILRADGATERV